MALLRISKEQRRQKYIQFVLYGMPQLSYLMVAVAFFWLLALPHENYNKGTYVSENALLPGHANVKYDYSDALAAEDYRHKVEGAASLASKDRAQLMEKTFSQIGLKSSTQSYSTSRSSFLNNSTSISGVNTYAVFHAPRSDGTEAIVLSAGWISRNKAVNANGIAMLLSLAKSFKKYSHYSKDIIFVITDGDTEGLQAWLRAYHGVEGTDKNTQEESLRVRSGAIQAALNLDFPGTGDYNAMGVFFEGVNGQLPNLDMINSLVDIAVSIAPVELTLHDQLVPYTENKTKTYLNSLKKMLHMMKYQTTGQPSGNHGLYLRYKIDAITLYGIDQPGWNSQRYGLLRLGAVLESTVRSLNNLLEHLHQSFFFYLLSGLRRYISIGLYMPPVIILGVSFICYSLSLWGLSSDLAIELKTVTPERKTVSVILPYSRRPRDMKLSAAVIGMSFVAGFMTYQLLTTEFGFSGENTLLKFVAGVGVCSMMILTSVSSIHAHQQLVRSKEPSLSPSTSATGDIASPTLIGVKIPPPAAAAPAWIQLKILILALSALFVTSLSALNFSLAVTMGILIAIPHLSFRPTVNVAARVAQIATLLAISPLGLALSASWWFGIDLAVVIQWVVDGYQVLGTWLLPTICCLYWPLNLAMMVMVMLPLN